MLKLYTVPMRTLLEIYCHTYPFAFRRSLGFVLRNSFRQRGIFDRICLVLSSYGYIIRASLLIQRKTTVNMINKKWVHHFAVLPICPVFYVIFPSLLLLPLNIFLLLCGPLSSQTRLSRWLRWSRWSRLTNWSRLSRWLRW